MAWKNFQNGYPLYASELNNYLMKQSVAVFASAAERDSILTAPTEGQVVWLQDSNAFKIYNGTAWTDINDNTDAIPKTTVTTAGDLIVATGSAEVTRLGLGTSGQVLSSDGSTATWTTPSSPSKTWTLLGSVNLTGSNTVTLSGIGGYSDLVIFMENASGAGGSGGISIRFNGDTSASYYTNYSSYLSAGTYSTTNLSNFSGTVTYLVLGQMGTNSGSIVNGRAIVSGATTAGVKMVQYSGSGNAGGGNSHYQFIGQSYWNNSAAITSVSAYCDNSSFDAGTMRVYGA